VCIHLSLHRRIGFNFPDISVPSGFRWLPLPGLAALSLVASPVTTSAQASQVFERREVTIPMRDGVTLHAVALVPAALSRPLPIILIRTPFNAAREFPSTELPTAYRELAQDGYIFVVEDIRGRYGSGGTFVTSRAQNDPRSPHGINESTDAWDTIDWLVKHLASNNGRVGVIGHSYRGWLAGLAGAGAHPALKAISPQAPTTDTWLGDDFFHQGAFRQTQGVAYAAWIESGEGFSMPETDEYSFYRRFPTLDSLASATGVAGQPSWRNFVAHPAYDSFWQARAMQHVLTRPEVPILFVGGWWDQEDILGPELAYRTVEGGRNRAGKPQRGGARHPRGGGRGGGGGGGGPGAGGGARGGGGGGGRGRFATLCWVLGLGGLWEFFVPFFSICFVFLWVSFSVCFFNLAYWGTGGVFLRR
jgi:predicted acyl esterase